MILKGKFIRQNIYMPFIENLSQVWKVNKLWLLKETSRSKKTKKNLKKVLNIHNITSVNFRRNWLVIDP